MEVFSNSCSCRVSQVSSDHFPQGFKLPWITLSSSHEQVRHHQPGHCIHCVPAHFASRDLPASQESRIAVDWVFPGQDVPQAAFCRWELGIPCFSKPIPSWIQTPFPSAGCAELLTEHGEYPGWVKVVLEHPVDVVLLPLAGCGLKNWDRQEASPGLSTGERPECCFLSRSRKGNNCQIHPTRRSQSWNSSGFPCN